MELGKDVIALDPKGRPCAFQLKTGRGKRITLNEWRKSINTQVHDLVTLKLVHPSLPKHRKHRSFLVTNSGIDEEVIRAIVDLNQKWQDQGQRDLKLETIVGGELYQDAVNLGTNLWLNELVAVRTLLELFLLDGRGPMPLGKLSELLRPTLFLDEDCRKPTNQQMSRAFSSAAVISAIAMKSFTDRKNYVAQIEAWVTYLSHVCAAAERWRLPNRFWKNDFGIALAAIENLLEDLVEELDSRNHLVEGDPTTDMPFRPVRVTALLALVAIYVLWHRLKGTSNEKVESFAKRFSDKYRSHVFLWGEGAVPQLLAFYWYWRTVDATPEADRLLSSLIEGICRSNSPDADPATAIANPYFSASEVMAERLNVTEERREQDFRRNSYSLEALIHLFVRRNWKQRMKGLWPSVTRVWFNRFDPKAKWRRFLWRTDEGVHWSVCPTFPKKWEELRNEAAENEGGCLPSSVRKLPVFVLLFLFVFPHRLNAEIVRWLDSKLRRIQQ